MATKQAGVSADIVPIERIAASIYVIRGQKVMLDSGLAALYGVETRALVQAVKRNADRFPEDFLFQLTKEESESLRSQIVISNEGGGADRWLIPSNGNSSNRARASFRSISNSVANRGEFSKAKLF